MSIIMMIRPNEISRYLLIIAATISVPPEDPLYDSARPIPDPQKIAPISAAMKGWSANKCWLAAVVLKKDV